MDSQSGWASRTELLVKLTTKNLVGMPSVCALSTSFIIPMPANSLLPQAYGTIYLWAFINLQCRWATTIPHLIDGIQDEKPRFPAGWLCGVRGPHCIPGSWARLSSGCPPWWCCPRAFYLLPALLCITSFLGCQCFLCHFPTYKINPFIESLFSRATVGWTQLKTHFHLRNNE